MNHSQIIEPEDKRRRSVSPTQTIVICFTAIILLGALLLWLPFSSRDGKSCDFIVALFTATSATCITGLSLTDTWTQWSPIGQVILLILIEIGGLGFMSALTLVVFVFKKKISLRQRMIMAQALGVEDIGGIVRLQRWMIDSTLLVQLFGAIFLFFDFLPRYGAEKAAWMGIFLSVSAYCNAGFDVIGFELPGQSIVSLAHDPLALIVISLLIIYGGFGFLVTEQLIHRRKFNKLNLYARIVICMTLILVVCGTLAFCLTEWNNPKTIGNFTFGDKILGAYFQSVTTRTAGFAAVDQAGLTEAGKALTTALMMIGGASSSTAGGIKVGTFFVILTFLWARLRGRSSIVVFNRSVTDGQVLNAMTITGIMVLLSLLGCVFISANSGVTLGSSLYEAVSAISNTGLSTIGTANLRPASWILLILYMFFGRVGVFTISLSFLIGNSSVERIHYPETKLLIG